ncbi:hypothetical protein [Kitasatospora sp. McL0602]|uniref:hypothetical protein n=1 Tax=Kitasatospora sp. McL0602 TaxID=3439530 RepID=UPI003F88A939
MNQGIAVQARPATITTGILAPLLVGLLAFVGAWASSGVSADPHTQDRADVGWNAVSAKA